MPRPTLAPNGVVGVLVPWGNTTTQLEIEPLTPNGMVNAISRFNFGPGVDLDSELVAVAEKIRYVEPEALLLSLSPEMGGGGFVRARALAELIASSSGVPAFTTTAGTLWALQRRGLSRIGLVGPADEERMKTAVSNFGSEGISVVRWQAMSVGLRNIKATPLDAIADAFRAVDTPEVQAFVQIGTGLPAFAVAGEIEEALGRPVITTGAAGYSHLIEELGLATQ